MLIFFLSNLCEDEMCQANSEVKTQFELIHLMYVQNEKDIVLNDPIFPYLLKIIVDVHVMEAAQFHTKKVDEIFYYIVRSKHPKNVFFYF